MLYKTSVSRRPPLPPPPPPPPSLGSACHVIQHPFKSPAPLELPGKCIALSFYLQLSCVLSWCYDITTLVELASMEMTLVVLHLMRHKRFASKSWGLNMTFCKVSDYLNMMCYEVVPLLIIQGIWRREIDIPYLPFLFGDTAALDRFTYDFEWMNEWMNEWMKLLFSNIGTKDFDVGTFKTYLKVKCFLMCSLRTYHVFLWSFA
jgi:hypothetical protein